MLPQVSGALNPTNADSVQINWLHSLHYEFTPGVKRGSDVPPPPGPAVSWVARGRGWWGEGEGEVGCHIEQHQDQFDVLGVDGKVNHAIISSS